MTQNNANFELNFDLGQSRFVSCTDDDISKLINDRHSKNTKRSTARCVAVFREYLEAKGESIEFENFEKDKLKKLLTKFYAEARKKDGSDYRKSSLQNLKHGLKRYLREKCDLDISGSEFNDANKVFAAKVVDLKRHGKGDMKHKESIEAEDLSKMYTYFEQYDKQVQISPSILQQKVFFDISLHFCR